MILVITQHILSQTRLSLETLQRPSVQKHSSGFRICLEFWPSYSTLHSKGQKLIITFVLENLSLRIIYYTAVFSDFRTLLFN